MTEKQIIEGNLKVAKMIGCEVLSDGNVTLPDWFEEASWNEINEKRLKFHCDYNWFHAALKFFFNYVEQQRLKGGLPAFAIQTQVLTPMAVNWKKYYALFLEGNLLGLFEHFLIYVDWYNINKSKF